VLSDELSLVRLLCSQLVRRHPFLCASVISAISFRSRLHTKEFSQRPVKDPAIDEPRRLPEAVEEWVCVPVARSVRTDQAVVVRPNSVRNCVGSSAVPKNKLVGHVSTHNRTACQSGSQSQMRGGYW
jgi:hypothetical protein